MNISGNIDKMVDLRKSTRRDYYGYAKKNFLKVIIFCMIILVTGLGYWYWTRTVHWESGPEVVFTHADLSQVHWEDPVVDKLANKRVVAVTFDNDIIVTDPSLIREIVSGLLRSKQYWFSSCFIAGTDLGIVFENKKTGMIFQAAIDIDKKKVQSVDWESKELYPLFMKIMNLDEEKIRAKIKEQIGWGH
jgi:hypothetical protein